MTLRGRIAVSEADLANPLLASGYFRHGAGPLGRHTVSADLVAFHTENTEIYSAHGPKPLLSVTFPHHEQLGLRSHAETVTLWDKHGRLVAADLGRRRPLASLSL